jgi:hypothetical protein
MDALALSLQRLHHRYSKCPQHIVMLLDRDIFAGNEPVIAETVPTFIIFSITTQVIMKCPGTVGFSYEMSDFVNIPTPEAPHPAAVAMSFPLACADPPVIGNRRSEFVTSLATSIGEILIARQL